MTSQKYNNITSIVLHPMLSKTWMYAFMACMLMSLDLLGFESTRRTIMQQHRYGHVNHERTGFPILDEDEFASAALPFSTSAKIIKQAPKPEKEYALYYLGMLTVLFLTTMVKLLALITRPIGKLHTVWSQVKGS